MTEHRLEVADVFREYGAAYLDAFGAGTSAAQRRVLRDLARCRTAELGGHVEECDHCRQPHRPSETLASVLVLRSASRAILCRSSMLAGVFALHILAGPIMARKIALDVPESHRRDTVEGQREPLARNRDRHRNSPDVGHDSAYLFEEFRKLME
jgi:hypothetical protein